MQDLWQDIRYGARRLIRSPGFTTVALLTLALGIGAVSSIFTLVNSILLSSLPYPKPENLVYLSGQMSRDNNIGGWPVGYMDLNEARDRAGVFEGVGTMTNPRSFNLTAEGEVEHITGEMVSADYFKVLGVSTVLGRSFSVEEARPPGAARVVVLSHDLWERRFGSDPAIVDKTIQLSEQPYTVIGVAKAGFRGMTDEAQLWMPIGLAHSIYGAHYTEMRPWRWLSGVARLKDGVTPEQAQKGLETLFVSLEKEYPADNEGFRLVLTPLSEAFTGDLKPKLLALLGASALVLLIACTNVANLLLARASSRRREMSLRSALGAGSFRLVRQLLTESLLLSIAGCVLGLFVASWFAKLLVTSSGMTLPSFLRFDVDFTVVGVTFALALVSGLLFGLVPAWMATRVNLQEGLKEGAQGSGVGAGRSRFQSGLVIAEVALALSLLAGAGLMIKGLRQHLGTDLGFETENLLTLRLDLTAERYKDDERVFALARQVLEQSRSVAGVTNVALEGPGYPTGGMYGIHLVQEGKPDAPAVMGVRHHVSPGYFKTLGIPILAGRDLNAEDVKAAPEVVVVSKTLAERHWPGENPIGKRLRGPQPGDPIITVVGMVADVKHNGLSDMPLDPDLYLSLNQNPPRSPSIVTVMARTSVPPTSVVAPLQSAIKQAVPELPSYDVATMQDLLDRQTAEARFLVFLMSVFAGIALVLASIGVYGVLAYTVNQRTREIGIRVALGARRDQVIGMVIRRGLTLVSIGVAAGLIVVLICNRFVESWLYGVSPSDPATLAGTAIILLFVALAASYLPARRATRIEPVIALRQE